MMHALLAERHHTHGADQLNNSETNDS